MKKILTIIISLSFIFLVGCSQEAEQVNENKNIENIVEEQITDKNNNIEEIKDEDNIQDIKDTESVNKEDYEEIARIAEEINLEDYNMHLEFDNKEKRIILFNKNGKNMYKSIFIKEKGRLKLIDLTSGEGELINEII